MLTRLTVRNLAIVEAADVAFGEGLNIITGETGAGKSVLMGALELVLGARADASTVRDGAKEARVEAEFALSDAQVCADVARILDDAGLPPCEDGALIVRRTVSATGGGRVHVNDAASTVQTLRALGRLLVDVHGPNDHQSLLEESFQRRLLDAYGAVLAWIYKTAAGIAADPKSPGFKNIVMAPKPDRRIGYVKAEYKTPHGLVKSAWRYNGNTWIWTFTVPADATASVTVPGETEATTFRPGTYTIERRLP